MGPNPFLRQSKQVFQNNLNHLSPLLSRLAQAAENAGDYLLALSGRPLAKRFFAFTKRYSAQLGFTGLLIVFLTIAVGEGQAYDVDSPKLNPVLANEPNDGFFGKPQILGGQTISTGEVQQLVAIVYTIEPGDSIVSVAKRYNISPGTIFDANKINPVNAAKITPGTEILIPAEDTNTSQNWLAQINAEKERQLALAEKERQKQLAKQREQQNRLSRNGRSSSPSISFSGDVTAIGSEWGAYNGGVPGQCTWLVNKYRKFPGPMGNGGQYLASARRYGLATGSIPRTGAVIVTSESYWGHVGIVRGVSGNIVTIEEMNYLGVGKKNYRKIAAGSWFIKGYVY